MEIIDDMDSSESDEDESKNVVEEQVASESDEDDSNFDADEVAERAMLALPQLASGVSKLRELSLDIGLGEDDLYISSSGPGQRKAFDTAAPPGINALDLRDFASAIAPDVPEPAAGSRDVRAAALRPVDDAKLRRKEAKQRGEERLDKWFGMRKRQLTPELEKELRALKLRANFDPKRFYKANDSKELPKYFAIATEVGGGLAPAGVKQTVHEPHALSGRSFLDSVLRDEKAQEWTWKKFGEVGVRGLAAANSGHGSRNNRKAKGRHAATPGVRRGGAWKKNKHS